MTTRRTEAIVGLVVLAAIALLIFGMLWLNRIEVGRNKYYVKVAFEDAGGLRAGDPVTVAGIEKGKVSKLSFDSRKAGVVVTLMLDSDVRLNKDAQIWLLDANMMGDMRVSVYTGTSDEPLDLSLIPDGQRAPGLMETMVKMGYLANEAGTLIQQMKQDLATPANIKQIAQTLQHINSTAAQLNQMATENRAALKETVRDVNRLVSPNQARLDSTIRALSRASAALDSISYKINSGQGTAGQMVNSRELYDEVKKTNKQLQDLIADIKANPKKYLTVKVF